MSRLNFSSLAQVCLMIATGSALSLQTPQSLNNQLSNASQEISGSSVFLSPNGLTISLIPSALDAPLAQCNAAKFGSPLDLPSCQEAIELYDPNDDQLTFKSREGGRPFDIGLPSRVLSRAWFPVSPSCETSSAAIDVAYAGMTVANGECSVQVFLIAPAEVAHASATEIRRAAQAVFDKCARRSTSRGGVASRIGEYHNGG